MKTETKKKSTNKKKAETGSSTVTKVYDVSTDTTNTSRTTTVTVSLPSAVDLWRRGGKSSNVSKTNNLLEELIKITGLK